MTPLFGFYKHATDIAFGAPRVISHRLHRMGPAAAWSPATAIEAQLMVTEKVHAMGECWLACWAAVCAPAAWPLLGAAPWWTPGAQQRTHKHLVHSANRMLQPLSSRVNANVKRLGR
jgi:hypothetical protein